MEVATARIFTGRGTFRLSVTWWRWKNLTATSWNANKKRRSWRMLSLFLQMQHLTWRRCVDKRRRGTGRWMARGQRGDVNGFMFGRRRRNPVAKHEHVRLFESECYFFFSLSLSLSISSCVCACVFSFECWGWKLGPTNTLKKTCWCERDALWFASGWRIIALCVSSPRHVAPQLWFAVGYHIVWYTVYGIQVIFIWNRCVCQAVLLCNLVQERCNAAKASVQLLGLSQSTNATGGVIVYCGVLRMFLHVLSWPVKSSCWNNFHKIQSWTIHSICINLTYDTITWFYIV